MPWRTNTLESQAHSPKTVSDRGITKTKRTSVKSRKSTGTCLHVSKNRHRHAFTSWHDWVGSGFGRCPFYPSHISNVHLRYLNMSGASFFAGAHHFVANNGTFIEAKIVSGMFAKDIRQASRRFWIFCGSAFTAIGQRGSFPLCQIQALGSLGVQKPSRNSRGIFLPTQMMWFRSETSSCYMEWGVLERLRFA